MQYIDSHCHLPRLFKQQNFYNKRTKKFNTNLTRYQGLHPSPFPAGFRGCVSIWDSPSEFDSILPLLEDQPRVAGAFGVHPLHATEWTEAVGLQIEEMLDFAPRAVAWGEIGLDYYRKPRGGADPDRPLQRRVFRSQLQKAVRRGNPLVIHGRDAEEELFKIMKELVPRDYPVHRHCVTNPTGIPRFLQHFENSMLGFTGLICNDRKAREAVALTPICRLLVETDSPYFPPPAFRGLAARYACRSHPGCAERVVREVAKIKDLEPDEVSDRIVRNTIKLYDWTPPPAV